MQLLIYRTNITNRNCWKDLSLVKFDKLHIFVNGLSSDFTGTYSCEKVDNLNNC